MIDTDNLKFTLSISCHPCYKYLVIIFKNSKIGLEISYFLLKSKISNSSTNNKTVNYTNGLFYTRIASLPTLIGDLIIIKMILLCKNLK